jgi:hypothetical protein
MQPFNGNAALAARIVDDMEAHRKADRLAQGTYWDPETGRGCAIGCLVQSDRHEDAAKLCNAPVEIMYIVDTLFENIPQPDNLDWPVIFLTALRDNPTKDISSLWLRLALEMAGHPVFGYKRYNDDPRVSAVASLYDEWLTTRIKPSDDRWRAAGDAARAAANDAIRASDRTTALAAAYAAGVLGDDAGDVAYAACDTAYAVGDTAYASTRAAYWHWLASTTIDLINTSPIAKV